jgi:enoyl-CoA hydratase
VERANACGPEVMDGLEHWLEHAGSDSSVRALVLTGTGSVFCAGADMKFGATVAGDPNASMAFIQRGRSLVDALVSAPKPVIAAVNGAAFAGGFELVQAADIVVAVAGVLIGDRHIRYGLLPGWGSSARLPRLIGRRPASRLLLTGLDATAEELAALGLVSDVVAADELESAVDRIVERLSTLDQQIVSLMLRLCRAAPDQTLDEALEAEWAALGDVIAARSERGRWASPTS